MSARRVLMTKNYALFVNNAASNRPLELSKHTKLKESMEKYGFIPCFPIVVSRTKSGKLLVKGGQHRLAYAEELGLPVYYMEDETDFDAAGIEDTHKAWTMKDRAQMYAQNDKEDYLEGLAFCELHRLPIGRGFSLLSGHVALNGCKKAFLNGTFKIKDRPWAEAVAALFTQLCDLAPDLKHSRMIEACMAVCRVKGFDTRRLILGAKRCREKLAPYSTRDACLDALETIYNYGRQQLYPLKTEALMALRERDPVERVNDEVA